MCSPRAAATRRCGGWRTGPSTRSSSTSGCPASTGSTWSGCSAASRSHAAVVFVTAYEDFAVDAFALKACDYLLKPVRRERLAEAVRRVAALIEGGGAPGPVAPERVVERIPVDLGGVTRFVSRDEVAYVEAQGDYVRLHAGGDAPLLRIPLASLEERWAPHGFLRIHRRYLVSLRHVEELRSDAGHWTVRTVSAELPVSRRHTRELRDLLTRWASAPGEEPS